MSSRKRAKPGTSGNEEEGNSGGFLDAFRRYIPNFSSVEQGEETRNGTNIRSSSVPSTQESPQSFQTQEGMDIDHSGPSKRELDFASANDPHSDGDDVSDHELNDEHDESSYSSAMSSSEDEEEDVVDGMTLMEKRRRNKERNALRHQELFRDYQTAMGNSEENGKAKKKDTQYEYDDDENDEKPRARGMLMKRNSGLLTPQSKSFSGLVKELEEQYPHREPQIRRLLSLFQSTIGQVSKPQQSSGFVPAPLFVIGSTGTGKTSVVWDTLALARADSSPPTFSTDRVPQSEVALINCATLEPATIGRLIVSISQQLRPSLKRRHSNPSSKNKQRKRKRKQNGGNDVATVATVATASSTMDENEEGSSEARKQQRPLHVTTTNNDDDIDQENTRRVQPTRAAKVMDTNDSLKHTKTNQIHSNDPENDDDDAAKPTDRIESPHSAVMALGRSLLPYYGTRSKRCGFVILDQNPERLLTMSSSDGRNDKSNVLAELLLLPRVMQLNICFVVVTTNRLLPGSRLNNIAGPTKASATLMTALRPMCVQFPAYKGNDCFKKILKAKRAQDTVTGSYTKGFSCQKEFFDKLVDTFLSSLIQFLSDSTRDINDYLRVGRSLWPVFIRPIHPKNIHQTMKVVAPQTSAASNDVDPIIETRILNHLGQKLLRFTSAFSSEDPTGLLLDLSSHKKLCHQNELKLTHLQLCLLLASFICQSNRIDQDKKFFASAGNGKKRKNNKSQQGEGETIAFSASANEVKQLFSLRPRPFQLERVLSIFVTLVRLNPKDAGVFADMDEKRIQTLGSTRLDMDLKQLVDLGFLHPASAAGRHANENIDRARFWCSLTRSEADRIAKRASIPLDNYML
ncbi:unnamed protein product [Cylindrotheca closterium]|uniref:Origin recognition complex subunit 5 C-terminal domain-containing protein n=1 Tax=Cylindrotheca closterium TaxID=2856 RepID=A0AAD2GCH9_9STRA|nr:unnamed protein product [Cylindrotheca closterium]